MKGTLYENCNGEMRMEESISANLEHVLSLIRQAAEEGADLIVFPELTLTPFFPQYSGGDGKTYQMLADGSELKAIAEQCRNCHIAAAPNIYLAENEKHYDASFLIDDSGEIISISKMVHIASFPHFYEKEYYDPSDTGFQVCDLQTKDGILRVGTVICFDRHFPESVRISALKGADVVLIPTANLTSESEDLFLSEFRTLAMQNSVYVIMVNRVGTEGEITFCGHSAAADFTGNVYQYGDEEEALLFAELSCEAVRKARKQSPYFLARRPEGYEALTRRDG